MYSKDIYQINLIMISLKEGLGGREGRWFTLKNFKRNHVSILVCERGEGE